MDELVPLRTVLRGMSVEIGHISGPPDCVQRLQELGLRAGSRLQVVQQGSPCIIRIRGSKLCVREDQATSVLVRI